MAAFFGKTSIVECMRFFPNLHFSTVKWLFPFILPPQYYRFQPVEIYFCGISGQYLSVFIEILQFFWFFVNKEGNPA